MNLCLSGSWLEFPVGMCYQYDGPIHYIPHNEMSPIIQCARLRNVVYANGENSRNDKKESIEPCEATEHN